MWQSDLVPDITHAIKKYAMCIISLKNQKYYNDAWHHIMGFLKYDKYTITAEKYANGDFIFSRCI